MIIDTLENMKNYSSLLPCLGDCEKFIAKCRAEKLECGKYEICGKELFASVQSYTSKDPAVSKTEAHREYIDLQFILSGTEEMLMADVNTLELVEEKYSAGVDCAFYKGELTTRTVLSKDCFAILFPSDAHCPGVMHKAPEVIEKIVFKIKVK